MSEEKSEKKSSSTGVLPYYAPKEITGRVKPLSFESGRVGLADKDKTYIFVPSSLLSSLCVEVLKRPYITFTVDGKIVVSFKQHSFD